MDGERNHRSPTSSRHPHIASLRRRHFVDELLVHIKPGALGPWRRLQHAQQAGILFRQHLVGGWQQRQVEDG